MLRYLLMVYNFYSFKRCLQMKKYRKFAHPHKIHYFLLAFWENFWKKARGKEKYNVDKDRRVYMLKNHLALGNYININDCEYIPFKPPVPKQLKNGWEGCHRTFQDYEHPRGVFGSERAGFRTQRPPHVQAGGRRKRTKRRKKPRRKSKRKRRTRKKY